MADLGDYRGAPTSRSAAEGMSHSRKLPGDPVPMRPNQALKWRADQRRPPTQASCRRAA